MERKGDPGGGEGYARREIVGRFDGYHLRMVRGAGFRVKGVTVGSSSSSTAPARYVRHDEGCAGWEGYGEMCGRPLVGFVARGALPSGVRERERG